MKKISIIFITILLLITNFSVIFADETEVDKNDEPDTTETTEVSDESKINEIQNNINDINVKLNNVEKTISNLVPGGDGLLTTYDNLTEYQLQYFIDHYSEFAIYKCANRTNKMVQFIYPENIIDFIVTDEYYRVTINKAYTIYQNNIIVENDYPDNYTFNIYSNRLSDDNYYVGYFLIKYNNQLYYSLTPYTINIKNNGLNEYTITPESKYNLGYYPSGQSITITYDNSINDFFGYFDINGNLLSSNTSYTFDITENTNIVINYRAKEGIDYYPYMIYIIILLSFIVILNLFNGGKLYD